MESVFTPVATVPAIFIAAKPPARAAIAGPTVPALSENTLSADAMPLSAAHCGGEARREGVRECPRKLHDVAHGALDVRHVELWQLEPRGRDGAVEGVHELRRHRVPELHGGGSERGDCRPDYVRQRLHRARERACHYRHDVLREGADALHEVLHGLLDAVTAADGRKKVLPRALNHREGALYRAACLLGGVPGDALLLLHVVDGLHHVAELLYAEVSGPAVRLFVSVGVGYEALHLLLGAAIAKLQIIKHRIILLGEASVGVLHVLYVASEDVRIV